MWAVFAKRGFSVLLYLRNFRLFCEKTGGMKGGGSSIIKKIL